LGAVSGSVQSVFSSPSLETLRPWHAFTAATLT